MNLDERMKMYERASKFYLPRRQYTIIRVDGKAFHTWTKGCESPFDPQVHRAMCAAAAELCHTACGALFGYVQSDEISVVLQDFADYNTEAWFDNKVQKLASVAASVVTAYFNAVYGAIRKSWQEFPTPPAMFDARAFSVPTAQEAANYLLWRQQDAVRNSIQSAGFAHFSVKEMHGKKNNEVQEMLWRERDINWNDYPASFKRGSMISWKPQEGRSNWVIEDSFEFGKDMEALMNLVSVN